MEGKELVFSQFQMIWAKLICRCFKHGGQEIKLDTIRRYFPGDKKNPGIYQYPLLIIGVAAGIDYLLDLSNKRFGFRGDIINNTLVMLSSVYLLILVYFNGFPILHSELKQNLKYVEQRIKDDQSIYVYQDLVPVFWFYRDINY